MPQKLDEMVNAIARENPDWSQDRVRATAQETYRKYRANLRKKAGQRGGMPAPRKTARRGKKGG